jgi:hypothetical protein
LSHVSRCAVELRFFWRDRIAKQERFTPWQFRRNLKTYGNLGRPHVPVDDPCLAEQLASALIVLMLRSGVLTEADLLAVEGLSDEGRRHVKALIEEAAASTEADRRVKIPRDRLRVISASDDEREMG